MSRLTILLFILLLQSSIVSAEIAIIVSNESDITQISKEQLNALYMGNKNLLMRENIDVDALEQADDSESRKYFFQLLNGMSISQVNTYWARLRFSGQILPPKQLLNDEEVLKEIESDPRYLGYIDKQYVNYSVRVIYELK